MKYYNKNIIFYSVLLSPLFLRLHLQISFSKFYLDLNDITCPSGNNLGKSFDIMTKIIHRIIKNQNPLIGAIIKK